MPLSNSVPTTTRNDAVISSRVTPAPEDTQTPEFQNQRRTVMARNDFTMLKVPFPWKLWQLLEDAETHRFNSIVSWLPKGNGFVILDVSRFERDIMKSYFPSCSSYPEFSYEVRNEALEIYSVVPSLTILLQLYRYGFQLLQDQCIGIEIQAFTHKRYSRGNKTKSLALRRRCMPRKNKVEQVEANEIKTYEKCDFNKANLPYGITYCLQDLWEEKEMSSIRNEEESLRKPASSILSSQELKDNGLNNLCFPQRSSTGQQRNFCQNLSTEWNRVSMESNRKVIKQRKFDCVGLDKMLFDSTSSNKEGSLQPIRTTSPERNSNSTMNRFSSVQDILQEKPWSGGDILEPKPLFDKQPTSQKSMHPAYATLPATSMFNLDETIDPNEMDRLFNEF